MDTKISSYFFFILLLLAVGTAIVLFLPFLTPIVLAAAAAVVSYPIYRGFQKVIGIGQKKDIISSFLTVLVVLVIFLVPMFFFIAKLYSEIQSLYALLTDESGRSQVILVLNKFSNVLSDMVFNAFPAYSFDSLNVTEYLRDLLTWIFGNLDKIFSGFAKVAAYVFVFLLSLFYFLKDGAMIKRRFVSWSPLLDEHDEYISKTMKRAIHSVFIGTIVVAACQGILTGFGFAVFSIPAPALWGSLAGIAALIPAFGTSLVIIPGIIYLIFVGSYGSAIGLALWGALGVGLLDNLLGPYLVNRGMKIHQFIILISVFGGLATFGPIGFVFGPLIMAFLFALLEIYRNSFAPGRHPEHEVNIKPLEPIEQDKKI